MIQTLDCSFVYCIKLSDLKNQLSDVHFGQELQKSFCAKVEAVLNALIPGTFQFASWEPQTATRVVFSYQRSYNVNVEADVPASINSSSLLDISLLSCGFKVCGFAFTWFCLALAEELHLDSFLKRTTPQRRSFVPYLFVSIVRSTQWNFLAVAKETPKQIQPM